MKKHPIVKEIEDVIKGLQSEIGAIAKEEAVLDRRRDVLAATVEEAVGRLAALPDEDANEELTDIIGDTLGDFASEIGMTWNGDYNNGSGWAVGDPVEFWVASTC